MFRRVLRPQEELQVLIRELQGRLFPWGMSNHLLRLIPTQTTEDHQQGLCHRQRMVEEVEEEEEGKWVEVVVVEGGMDRVEGMGRVEGMDRVVGEGGR